MAKPRSLCNILCLLGIIAAVILLSILIRQFVNEATASIITAVGTLSLAIVAFWQIQQSREVLNRDKTPSIFVRDIHLRKYQVKGQNRFEIDTKGIANLSTYSIAIHSFHLLDKDEKIIASGYPLLVIKAGDVLQDQVKSRLTLCHLGLKTAEKLKGIAQPERFRIVSDLMSEGQVLKMIYRYAGTPSGLWVHTLKFKRDKLKKPNGTSEDLVEYRSFDGINSEDSNIMDSRLDNLFFAKKPEIESESDADESIENGS